MARATRRASTDVGGGGAPAASTGKGGRRRRKPGPPWWEAGGFRVETPADLAGVFALAGAAGEHGYRGVSRDLYRLEPRVARNSRHAEAEWDMTAEFHEFARSTAFQPRSRLELLALAQHHGLPTRFMDVTDVFGVALYFATCAEADAPSMVWCIDKERLSEATVDWYRRFDPTAGTSPSSDYVVFPDFPVFRDDRVRAALGLEESQRCFEAFTRGSDKPRHPPFLLAVPHITRRMTVQAGYFVAVDPLGGHLGEQLAALEAKDAIRGIRLVPDVAAAVREHLAALGINRRLLFPDLDNLAADIRERHGRPG